MLWADSDAESTACTLLRIDDKDLILSVQGDCVVDTGLGA